MNTKLKIFASKFLCVCLFICGGFIVACTSDSSSVKLSKVSDMYGFAALTTSALYSNETVQVQNVSEDNEYKQAIVDTLDKYVSIFENIVGGTKPVKVQKAVSDKEGYTQEIIVQKTNLVSDLRTYKFYYNETDLLDFETKVEDSDDYKHSSKINGIIIVESAGSVLYQLDLEGSKIVEDGEIELEFTVTLDDKKIIYNQEVYNDEQEFSYKMYKGSTLLEEISFELESEDNEIEADFQTTINESQISFRIEEKLKQNKPCLEVKYEKENQDKIIEVVAEKEGENIIYNYKFNDGTIITKTK